MRGATFLWLFFFDNMSKRKLSTFFKILILLAACLIIALIIVWPLWKFATEAPKVYTAVILGIVLLLIIFAIVKKVMSRVKTKNKK